MKLDDDIHKLTTNIWLLEQIEGLELNKIK